VAQAVWPAVLEITWALLSEKWDLSPSRHSLTVASRTKLRTKTLDVQQLKELQMNMTLLSDVLTPMVRKLRLRITRQRSHHRCIKIKINPARLLPRQRSLLLCALTYAATQFVELVSHDFSCESEGEAEHWHVMDGMRIGERFTQFENYKNLLSCRISELLPSSSGEKRVRTEGEGLD